MLGADWGLVSVGVFVRALERMLKCAWGGLGSGECRCVCARSGADVEVCLGRIGVG